MPAFGAPTPAEMEAFIATYCETRWTQMLEGRFFRATVTQVISATPQGGFLVKVQRSTESASDGNYYACAMPGYVPVVGDAVDCIWRDPNVGYVLWPISRSSGAAGNLGFKEVTAASGTFTTVIDIPNLAVTVNTGVGRRIRISVVVNGSSTVADDSILWSIQEGATILKSAGQTCRPANSAITSEFYKVLTPIPGAHTYKVTGVRQLGTGNCQCFADVNQTASILVEDIGV